MSRPVRIDTFRGVDNKHAPETLVSLSREGNTAALTLGQNVDLSDTGHISRRLGFTQTLAGRFHSFWSNGSIALAVQDQQLVSVVFSPVAAATNLLAVGTLRMSYVDVLGTIYFSNGQMIGNYTAAGGAVPLSGFGDYDFDKQTLSRLDQHVSAPLPGTELEFFAGRLIVANEDALWYSRPYLPNAFDLRTDYLPWRNATLVKGVADGLYVGTETEVWFLSGLNPKAFSARKVSSVGAIKGTSLSSQWTFSDGHVELVAVWESVMGKIIGRAGGQLEFCTEQRVSYPTGTEGASLIRDMNGFTQHISTFPSASGAESQNMRTTDIAVAEVRRNGIII
jgi:hypothetical protein